MSPSSPSPQADALEKMRQRFDFGPYPRKPLEATPKDDHNLLFIHNLVTPYYLKHNQIPRTEGKLILDAGCGSGYHALTLAAANPGAKIVGVDLSPKSIELAKERAAHHQLQDRTEFYAMSIEEVAQLGLQFDYINCDEVLYFADSIADLLGAMRSVLSPQGIIRANLHSFHQRQVLFRAQQLFGLMGLMEDDAEEMALPIVVETVKALKKNVPLKALAWSSVYEDPQRNQELILSNHLLRGDKGYRIPDLFAALDQSGLELLSMVNWRQWSVEDLFEDPDNLPDYIAMGLAASDEATRLTMYELLNPVHRLLDFWCTHPDLPPSGKPVAAWGLADWQTAHLHLHPQLKTEKFREAAVQAIQSGTALVVSQFIALPALKPVVVEPAVASLLLRLWQSPQPFTALVATWQRIHPVDLVTLEPLDQAAATQAVAAALGRLEPFLYILAEQP
ncbi:MAG: class I SAM-dependent methyltransferase [Leptolyngbya sp. DLM2.Bin27]|nr:MAG: class I SAM-dependent methyltransferase [Leptolyngbya sp. DLM2.Bin27]